jgi:hypothetical protein
MAATLHTISMLTTATQGTAAARADLEIINTGLVQQHRADGM